MELLNKMMSNITGITLGCGFMFSGLLVFSDPSIAWLQNIFIFFGLYIVAISMISSVRQYISSKDPNFDRITAISMYETQTRNANEIGKAKAFGIMAVIMAISAVLCVVIDRLWICAAVIVGAYAAAYIIGLREKSRICAENAEDTENASISGKRKAFDLMVIFCGAMLFILPIMGASSMVLSVIALGYIGTEIMSIRITYLEFARLWAERGVKIR